MRESSLILISTFVSVAGLLLIYTISITLKPSELELEQIDARLIGKTVKTTGIIVYKRYSKQGHLFLTISNNKTRIQIPLFYSFLEALSKKVDLGKLKIGTRITVTGTVDEYMSQLQIVPRKPEDLTIG